MKHKKDGRGRKQGELVRGSLMWRVSQLQPGEYLIVEVMSEGYRAGGTQANAEGSIMRAKQSGALPADRQYEVRSCIGHTVDLTELPFRFLRITRGK